MNTKTHFSKILLATNFIFTLHFTVIAYINSSFLAEFISVSAVGLVFVLSALLSLLFLTQVERLFIAFGDFKVTFFVLLFDIAALFGIIALSLSNVGNSILPVFFFIVHYTTAVFILRTTLDVHFEEHTKNKDTGIIRGGLLTSANAAWLISPIIFSLLLSNTDFWKVYAISFLLSIVLLILVLFHFPKERVPQFSKMYFFQTLSYMRKKRDLFFTFLSSLLLHIFFSWMVIYLPLYLHQVIGMSWTKIGLLFTIMLLPYVLLDIPLGYISDKHGEKKLLSFGFVIAAVFTGAIFFIQTDAFLIWAVVLFISRIGATIIEIMTDTHLFRNIAPEDGNIISVYRSAQPMAYIIAPAFASALFFLVPGFAEIHLFLLLAVITFSGFFASQKLTENVHSE